MSGGRWVCALMSGSRWVCAPVSGGRCVCVLVSGVRCACALAIGSGCVCAPVSGSGWVCARPGRACSLAGLPADALIADVLAYLQMRSSQMCLHACGRAELPADPQVGRRSLLDCCLLIGWGEPGSEEELGLQKLL